MGGLIFLQINDVAMNQPPAAEEQQKLLQEAWAKRDLFALDKARVENLLNIASEKVQVYKALLGAAETKLFTVEDLIGNIRCRLQQRGLPTRAIMTTSPAPTPTNTCTGETSRAPNPRMS